MTTGTIQLQRSVMRLYSFYKGVCINPKGWDLEMHPGKMITGTFDFEKENNMIANEYIDEFIASMNKMNLNIIDIPPRVLLRDFYKSLTKEKKRTNIRF